MSEIYVKRNSIVSAEQYDPDRTDQGVTVNRDAAGNPISRTIISMGRVTSVRPGDMLVSDDRGTWNTSAISFAGLYQPLAEVVTPDSEAISQTGGNQ